MAYILALSSGDWHTSTNWTGGVVPGVGDVAVLNGKTMTMNSGSTITCAEITNNSTLGAINGKLNLVVGTYSTFIFTINANVKAKGASVSDMVQFSNSSVQGSTITINVTGDITAEYSASQSRTFYLATSGTAPGSNITFNLVGDAYSGSLTANTASIYVTGTTDNCTINVTGNLIHSGGVVSSYCVYNNVQGIAIINVSGYVQCGSHTTQGLLAISSSVSAASSFSVGAGVVPGGTGAAISSTRCSPGVINSAPDGVAIRPGVSFTAVNIGSNVSTLVVNGHVLGSGGSPSLGAIITGSSTTNMRTITINGNMTCENGLTTKGVLLVAYGVVSITINGSINMAAFNAASVKAVSLLTLTGVGSKFHVSGDVIGPDAASAGAAGILLSLNTGGLDLFRVDGTVYAGRSGPAIQGDGTSSHTNISALMKLNSVRGCILPPATVPYPAIEKLSFTSIEIGGDLIFGSSGVPPITYCAKVKLASTARIMYQDTGGVDHTATLSNATANVPSAADVRSGVAVGSTVGSLVVPQAANVQSGVVFDNGTTGALAGLTSADLVPIAKEATLAAVKVNTDQLAFTGSGVVADSSGVATNYTARFDALDTVTAAVKTKTDQLSFTANGVVADSGAVNYASRFNALDAAVAAIPTVTYSSRFDSIDTDLGNLIAGGGVDFTPVLTALTAVDGHVSGVQTTANIINAKTSQLVFTVDGVTADVAVSVGNVINYDARFDTVDTATAAIKAKTDLLTFGASGVNATASIDTTPIVSAVSGAVASAVTPIYNVVVDTNDDLLLHDTQIKAQLTTIQNATGAIDLSPITTSLATINTNVLAIPTTTYSGRFNSVDAQLVSIQGDVGNVSVDLTPVTTAIAAVDTHVLAIPTTSYTASLQAIAAGVAANLQATDGVATIAANTLTAVSTNTVDLTPVLEAIDSHVVDLTPVTDACAEIKSRFDAVTPGSITVIPQSPSGTSTAYGHVRDANGAPLAGETVTLRVTQAHGTGTILDATPITATSDAEGLVTFTIIRSPDIVYSVQFGLRTEKFRGVDAATVQLPSMIKR